MAVVERTASSAGADTRACLGGRRRVQTVGRYLLLTLICVVFAFPFYWVVLTSLETPEHVFDFPPHLLPMLHGESYATAWSLAPWGQYFVNTCGIALSTTLLVLVTSTLAGYALGTMEFLGKRVITALLLSTLIMPAVVAIIPDYVIAKDIGWLNTYWVQIIPWGASTFGIFLMANFLRGLPVDLFEAARLDGCSRLRYLRSVAVPLASPALLTVSVYTFLGSWNSLIWPLVMTNDTAVQPIEVGLTTFQEGNGNDWTDLAAATVFTTLPVMVLFLLVQRFFVEGVARTGLKG